jgi:hypothetical protein
MEVIPLKDEGDFHPTESPSEFLVGNGSLATTA